MHRIVIRVVLAALAVGTFAFILNRQTGSTVAEIVSRKEIEPPAIIQQEPATAIRGDRHVATPANFKPPAAQATEIVELTGVPFDHLYGELRDAFERESFSFQIEFDGALRVNDDMFRYLGLLSGDRITEINGFAVADLAKLPPPLGSQFAGPRLSIRFLRDSVERSASFVNVDR